MGLMDFLRRERSQAKCSHNSSERLTGKAIVLAQALHGKVRTQHAMLLRKISELSENVSPNVSNLLLLELILIQLHLADRISFEYLSSKQRDSFMKIVVHATARLLYFCEGQDAHAHQILHYLELLRAYSKKQADYAKFSKVVPDNDESAHGTLIWEFSLETMIMLLGSNIDIRPIPCEDSDANLGDVMQSAYNAGWNQLVRPLMIRSLLQKAIMSSVVSVQHELNTQALLMER